MPIGDIFQQGTQITGSEGGPDTWSQPLRVGDPIIQGTIDPARSYTFNAGDQKYSFLGRDTPNYGEGGAINWNNVLHQISAAPRDNSSMFKESLPALMLMASIAGGQMLGGGAGAASTSTATPDIFDVIAQQATGGGPGAWPDAAATMGVTDELAFTGPMAEAAGGALTPAAAAILGITDELAFTGPMATAAGGALNPSAAMSAFGSGAPVTDLSRAATFTAGNGVGSDISSIIKNFAGAGGGTFGGLPAALSVGGGVYGMYQARKLRELANLARTGQLGTVATPVSAGGANANANAGAAVNRSNAMVDQAVSQAAPFDTRTAVVPGTTGRQLATDKLTTLMNDPSSIFKMPGYEAGEQAVQRAMAAQGMNLSGNMLASLQKYGGDFYNNALQQLSVLSGATQSPATGAGVGISGAGNALAGGQLTSGTNLSAAQLALQSLLGTGNQALEGNVAANKQDSASMAAIGYGLMPPGGQLTPLMLAQMKAMGII